MSEIGWANWVFILWDLHKPKFILYFTFSPVSVTMSSGPYMKRPVTTWRPSSLNTASFTRWFAVTFFNTNTSLRQQLSCNALMATWDFRDVEMPVSPWSSHGSSSLSISPAVWTEWIRTPPSHLVPKYLSSHASLPKSQKKQIKLHYIHAISLKGIAFVGQNGI